ncbi:MAG TPA: polysaccharide deacetylase family protein [Blastocatellia bacterium]|nr:polysaccharide deacetylase family protein [Blastocatellia bacterium]
MNRRNFVAGLAGATLATTFTSFAATPPQVAITIDDPHTGETPRMSAEERNRAILDALGKNSNLKAALFVCGKRVDDEPGHRLLAEWNGAGHIIANHSYSHPYFHSKRISVEEFIEDIRRGEAVIKDLSRFRRLFRFPFLKEGDTVEKRDRLRAHLRERGYRNGHVTIDASDWYVDDRLRERLKKDPSADAAPYRDFYLRHIWDRATFYNGLVQKVSGYGVKHTLLVHHNLLNAMFLGDLIGMFKSRGWKLIDAENAFQDKLFSRQPSILPAGESLVWALAKQTGKLDRLLRYPGEDSKYEKAEMDRLGL